jgi:hypothetical protein
MGAIRQLGKSVLMRHPDYRCRDALRKTPIALYSEPQQLAVLWSAKAGCTFAVKWFFFQADLLEEALAYSPWPHEYRQWVFTISPEYKRQLRAVPSLGSRVVKFVRNPYDRAVSSFLQACQQSTQRVDHASPPVHELVGAYLGRPAGEDSPFTFREFVDFLSAADLDSSNTHIRRQISPCERDGRLSEMTIVKIEESARVLPHIEATLGLKESDFGLLRESPHHTLRADLPGFAGDTPFGKTREIAIPHSDSFYDEALLKEVGALYAEDCEAYGYAGPTRAKHP